MKKARPTILMLLIAFSLVSSTSLLAGKNEAQRFREAEKLFHAKHYEKAMPMFAQLVSSHPKNYKYNYYFGVCLLVASKEKSQALNYLDRALDNQKTPEEVYYYIGRALHLAYRFDEAREYINEFNTVVGRVGVNEWNTSQLLDMINNAERILDFSKTNQITAKTEATSQDFFDRYKFNQPQGKLLSMPDEMIANAKNSNEERPTIFLSGNGRVIYYSAFARETGSRDIYRVEKNRKGQWGLPVRLDRNVNSSQDETYPTCNHDGRILYFSSKGHNSTGGFDIFKSVYNSADTKWKKPTNMGSPINSPDDDYHFLSSTDEQKAYFSSQRESAPGTLTVYQIPYTVRETLPIAVEGRVITSGDQPAGGITVQVMDDATKNITSQLTCSTQDGTFPLEVNYPGLYTLTIQSIGSDPMTARIEITEEMNGNYLDDITYSPGSRLELSAPLANQLKKSASTEDGHPTQESTQTDAQTANGSVHASSNEQAFEIGDIDGGDITVFKVQIGAFRILSREVVKQRLEKMTDVNMLSSHNDNTWLRFYFGEEDSYESAHNLRNTLKQAGFKDAFVAAFRNGQPVNIREALGQSQPLANGLED